ncbi:MAG TPA: O-antigen ligase family protein [Pyrinomonadaceae bacterium]|nr:O-antigen ligase family protein [Pyrinomonadaceae bacterium]
MQQLYDIDLLKDVASDRTSAVDTVLLFTAVTLVVLAFIPLVPPNDAIKGGGLTLRGVIEFGLILTGLFLMTAYARYRSLALADLRSPATIIITIFVAWTFFSSIWSPNPFLAIAKGAELWAVALAGIMFVTLSRQLHSERDQLQTVLALGLVAALAILILANIFFWGTPLPSTGNEALPLHLLGEEPPALAERPRLLLAYAHPLLTGDFLALSVVCLFSTRLGKVTKGVGMALLLGLLWMTDARGPSVAVVAALIVMAILKVRRNSIRAVVAMLLISVVLAVVMIFQDALFRPFSSLLTDDVYTLNSRTELWPKAFEYIFEQPIIGYGYYSSRYLLMKDFIWAGHAHNSFIEIWLTTGLVGLILVVAYLAYLCRSLVTTQHCLLIGALVYTLIQGMLNPLVFTPGLPMFVLTIAALSSEYQAAQRRAAR